MVLTPKRARTLIEDSGVPAIEIANQMRVSNSALSLFLNRRRSLSSEQLSALKRTLRKIMVRRVAQFQEELESPELGAPDAEV